MPGSRIALLIAALVLPIVVIVGSYAATGGPHPPQVPGEVRVGVSPGLEPSPVPSRPPSGGSVPAPEPPGGIPPPPPDDDDEDDEGNSEDDSEHDDD